jgi:hypothetical protein
MRRYPSILLALSLMTVLTAWPGALPAAARLQPPVEAVILTLDDLGPAYTLDAASSGQQTDATSSVVIRVYRRLDGDPQAGPLGVLSGLVLTRSALAPNALDLFMQSLVPGGTNPETIRQVDGPPVGSDWRWITGETRAGEQSDIPAQLHLVAFLEGPYLGFVGTMGAADVVNQQETHARALLMHSRMTGRP